MVAAETSSPTPLSTGTLSPVKADSSTAPEPERITPSTGILSPGRTIKTSPFFTCSTGTATSVSSRSNVACWGESSIRERKALVVFPLERASNSFPTVIKVRIIAADSK